MANSKKHFVEEIITLSNGDQIYAKNLPIRQLRLFHKELETWTEHLDFTKGEIKRLERESRAEAEKDDNKTYEDILEEKQKEYDKAHKDDITFIDVSVNCALIALGTWMVRNEKNQTLDKSKIDKDYIEENVDMLSLNRIMEIAGAMQMGDVSKLEGKAQA